MRMLDAIWGEDGLGEQLLHADSELLGMLRKLRIQIREAHDKGMEPGDDEQVNLLFDTFYAALIEREHLALILDQREQIR